MYALRQSERVSRRRTRCPHVNQVKKNGKLVGSRARTADPKPPLQSLGECALAATDFECVETAYASPGLVGIGAVEQKLGAKDDSCQVDAAGIEKRRIACTAPLVRLFYYALDLGGRTGDVLECCADDRSRGMRAAEELDNEPVHHVGCNARDTGLWGGGGRGSWERRGSVSGVRGSGTGSHRWVVDRGKQVE